MLGCDGEALRGEVADFTLSRKASIEFKGARTVNRHRWVGEYPKASERTIVKELGKMTP